MGVLMKSIIIPAHWLIKYDGGTYSAIVHFDKKSATERQKLNKVKSTVVFVSSIEKEIVDE